jgi:hypothetical protein
LPRDRQTQLLEHDLAGELGHQGPRDDVFLPIILEIDDWELVAVFRIRVNRKNVCRPGLLTGMVVSSFFTATVSVKD